MSNSGSVPAYLIPSNKIDVSYNIAIGHNALLNNPNISYNMNDGSYSLLPNLTGINNTAVGDSALHETKGKNNTALGYKTGISNIIGNNNTFLGNSADCGSNNLNNSTAIGYNSKITASNQIVLGNSDIEEVILGSANAKIKIGTAVLDQDMISSFATKNDVNSVIINNNPLQDYLISSLSDGTTFFNVSNTNIFTALGNGLNGIVWSMCLVGTDLYIGGDFNTANGINVNYICKYDTTPANTSKTFTALGSGLNQSVRCMCLVGTDLYIGGRFTTANGTNANYICKYDTTSANTSKTFTALGSGLNQSVWSMSLVGTDLYIGGNFTTANRICKYDTTSANTSKTFTALGNGLDSTVRSMCLVDTDLYIGGDFTSANGTNTNYIYKYDTSSANTNNTFTALGSGFNGRSVYSMCLVGTDLYIGGEFTSANGTNANYICKYDTSIANTNNTFTALGSGINNVVYSMCLVGTDLYIGGEFTSANGTNANYICKYDTTSANTSNQFTALGSGFNDMNRGGIVRSMCLVGKYLYIGGQFSTANGTNANNICNYTYNKFNLIYKSNIIGTINSNNPFESIQKNTINNKEYIVVNNKKFIF